MAPLWEHAWHPHTQISFLLNLRHTLLKGSRSTSYVVALHRRYLYDMNSHRRRPTDYYFLLTQSSPHHKIHLFSLFYIYPILPFPIVYLPQISTPNQQTNTSTSYELHPTPYTPNELLFITNCAQLWNAPTVFNRLVRWDR